MATLALYDELGLVTGIDPETTIFAGVSLDDPLKAVSDCEELVAAQSDPYDIGNGTMVNKSGIIFTVI